MTTLRGKIESLAFGGSGIMRCDKKVIFVPFTAEGDEITAEITHDKKTYARAKLLKLHKESEARCKPFCSHFGRCGGCQLQHITYEEQLKAKVRFVKDALQRIGNIKIDDLPITPTKETEEYRQHITLTLRPNNHGFTSGYVLPEKQALLSITHCPIFTRDPILEEAQNFCQNLSSRGITEGSLRILKIDNTNYQFVFFFFPKLPHNREKVLETHRPKNTPSITFTCPKTTETHGKILPAIEIENQLFSFSPLGFIQNHEEQAKQLYRQTLDLIPASTKRLIDLYCGVGIIGLLAAKKGIETIGIESNPHSCELARQNAERNQLAVQFINAPVEEKLYQTLKDFQPETLILNPPREGLSKEVIAILLKAKVPHIIYISCMPTTLARDLKALPYKLDTCKLIDMFPHTTHVETIASLSLDPTLS